MGVVSLFTIGFILGLTGAMAPGPLLSVTISESIKRGGIVGPMVVLGHGVLELLLIVTFIMGMGKLLNSNLIYIIISLFGGFILIYMGYGTIKELKTYDIFSKMDKTDKTKMHPVLSGIVVSLSNPYWFMWWITIGAGYILFAKDLGLKGIIAFFIGHILSDFVWYSFVSYGIEFGNKFMDKKILKPVLFICSMFLICFGCFFIFKGLNFLASQFY